MLTVHCPRCATALMLDPASISDSHGWARCGHCRQVFDAGRLGLPTLDPQAQPTQANNSAAAATPSRTDAAQAGSASSKQAGVPTKAEPDHDATLDTNGGNTATSALIEPGDALRSDVASRQAVDLERIETGDTPNPVSNGPSTLGWPDDPTDVAPLQGLSVDIPTPHDGLDLGLINDPPRASTDAAWEGFDANPRQDGPADAHEDHLADPAPTHALFDAPPQGLDAEPAAESSVDPLLAAPAQWLNGTGEAAPEQTSDRDTALLAAAVTPAGESDTLPGPVSRSSRRSRLWRTALLLILLLLLAAQAVVLRRDWLAARFPQFQPHLSQVCAVLGCEIGAWRDVSELHVTQSAVVRMHDTHFQLDLDIENASLTRVAVPVLELTLKDDQEHVWSRRLLPLVVEGSPPYLSAQSRYNAQVNWRTSEVDAPLVQTYALRLVYADSRH